MSFSDYTENAVLNHLFRNSSLTSPTTVYVALMTTAPSDSAPGTEVSGGAYARQAITFGAPSGGVVTQSGDIVFPEATGNWGTVVGYGIFDASTAGNMLAHQLVTPNQAVNTGVVATIPSATITVTLT